MRIKLADVTAARIYSALEYRVKNIFHSVAWKLTDGAKGATSRFELFKDKHKGERCFIIANGPSLAKMDLSQLKDESTIGMNRVYLMFEEWGFQTSYLACVNSLVLSQFSKDINNLKIPKFLNWIGRAGYDRNNISNNFVRLKVSLQDNFQEDIAKPLGGGGTVTFTCLQIAYYMGFSEIVIIGMDHNFKEKGTPNKTEQRTAERDESHCHPDYFPEGVKWQLPDLYRSELAYKIARGAYEKDGRKIYDATVGGKCNVFEKKEFQEFLK